jgi:hypothetical protein
MVPKPDEWDTSSLSPSRRAYLDKGLSFEDIAALTVGEAQIQKTWIRPRYKPPNTNFRQVCFRIHVNPQAYDLFYNAPDGLRGRYWQSPDIGFLATRYLIDALRPNLLKFADENPPKIDPPKKHIEEMTIKEVGASLDAPSAKVWVREEGVSDGPELKVRRWALNEAKKPGSKLWRWTPIDNELEVKGALLDPTGVEHIPDCKLDRSCQIHHYGFT